MGAVREELAARLGTQTHLLRFWDELSEDERNVFAAQLDKIDVQECLTAFNESAHIYVPNPDNLEPIPAERHIVADDLNAEERQRLFQLGLESISRGELCCLVLAGGQASRLGSSEPKGTIPLGIDVAHGDSLLALQAAKIACLERLARESFPGTSGRIQWVVMTSLGTEKATLLHLNKIVPANGLSMDQVIVFSQDNIPAFDMEGNLLLSRKDEVSTAPNGNGGLYSALSHHLPTLQSRGVRYVQTYCVDNILCRVGDPAMLGMVIDKNADCAAKTVEKYVGELVGSITLDDGKVRVPLPIADRIYINTGLAPRVTEYSELGEKLASRVGPDGKLLFRAGNIAIHMFTMEFLESFSSPKFHLPYHRALKKITYVNEDGDIVKPEKPNGIKLEQFIFDVFPLSKNFFVWEVKREDEFSPLKNAESAGKDCLSSCVRDLSAQSIRWLHSAGAVIPPGQEVFLAAARSYAGEGLEEFSNKQIEERILF